MEVMLAIDGGGSRTRCLAIERGGRIVGEAASGPSNHLLAEMGTVVQSLREATGAALTRARLNPPDVLLVSAGLAGVDYDGEGAREMEKAFRDLSFKRALVNGDMLIAHAGALGARAGVVALSGTGSSILGIGPAGERVKVGGWGPVYGDEGSAYRIGQAALRAAARAADGRGPATTLTGALLRALGLRDFRETISRVYTDGMKPRDIAALSPVAYQAATEGDEVARAIFLEAGEETAEGVEAAIRLLGMQDGEVLVSYQGAVLAACALLRERFGEALEERLPGAVLVPPQSEPVIGAYLLGCREVGWSA